MSINSNRLIKVCLIIYFIILIIHFGHVFLFTDIRTFYHASKTGIENDFSNDWMLESGETVNAYDVSKAGFCDGKVISKILPDTILENDAVCFSTSNLRFNVYVDDMLIYSYDTEENITGMGDGVAFHMIGLGSKDEGKIFRIEGKTVLNSGRGGRLNVIQFGPEESFRYYLMRSNILEVVLSFLMIVFGLITILFYFGMQRKNPMLRSLWALGLSSVIFGIWSLCDTGIPQFMSGGTYAAREVIYLSLHLAGFPIVYFVNYVTKNKRKIYLCISFALTIFFVGLILFLRFAFGIGFNSMVPIIYASYGSQLLLLLIMLIDNAIYCRNKKITSNLSYFYFGAGLFVLSSFIDMISYAIAHIGSLGHGSWFRLGLSVFIISLAFQIFDWWAKEKTSLERDRFVNRILQDIMDSKDPDDKINKVLEYLCEELHADRAYIFEEMRDGTFDNTYEYCAEGVTPEINNLKHLPYKGVVDAWYEEYKKGGHILIYDLEKYREVSEGMYNVLKPQGIETLVTGPLILEGQYIGFFGVDNPPPAMMLEVSEIIRLLMYFLSGLIERRDNQRQLMKYSYQDALTGVGNRRAIRQFEKECLDTTRSYGLIMCDINGLKIVNDTKGHEAGDELIKTVSDCLIDIFGSGYVFRMGGDEFAIYVFADTLEEFEDKIKRFEVMIADKGYHVAIGYSFAPGGDPDYNAHKIEADNRMYDAKRRFYSEGNDRRRRSSDEG